MFLLFANFLLLAVQIDDAQGWCGYTDEECLAWKAYCAATQWNNYWTNKKGLQKLIFNWDLYPKVLEAAQNILDLKPHGLNTTEFCVYKETLNNTIGYWEDWMIQRLFNSLPFILIGSAAKHYQGTTYACALHAEWFDSKRTSGNNGDVKVVLCAYKVKRNVYCVPARVCNPCKLSDTVKIVFNQC